MPILRAPTKRPITLPAIHPNQGLEVAYRKKLDALVDEMQKSLVYWLSAAYRQNQPEIAQDASPAMMLREIMRKLSKRWQLRFDDAALDLAKYFATNASARVDGSLKAILKRSGFSVDFKLTAQQNDVLQACIGEQVGLIKSIASEHLSQVEGLVMRSVANGGDLKSLTDSLQERYGVTRRRAAFIAHDQNRKANATMTRVRQQSLGITEAIWMHSHAGREPRKSHLNANGKRYKIAEGMYLDEKWVWPGTEINCRCISRSIIPGLDD
jgi:SPP1 gp7 family putative phage head morphogenesis protein